MDLFSRQEILTVFSLHRFFSVVFDFDVLRKTLLPLGRDRDKIPRSVNSFSPYCAPNRLAIMHFRFACFCLLSLSADMIWVFSTLCLLPLCIAFCVGIPSPPPYLYGTRAKTKSSSYCVLFFSPMHYSPGCIHDTFSMQCCTLFCKPRHFISYAVSALRLISVFPCNACQLVFCFFRCHALFFLSDGVLALFA